MASGTGAGVPPRLSAKDFLFRFSGSSTVQPYVSPGVPYMTVIFYCQP
jgi:hypothetical protein